MLERARAAGFDPSGRLLSDWVSLGLIDRAERHGLGRGAGTSATWPANQLQLFLVLLRQRPTVTRMIALCNIPVALWLWWGDDYVPTRQTRRALETWSGRRGLASSWRTARANAEELVGRFSHPDTPAAAHKDLVDLVASTAMGRPFNGVEMLAAFRKVFDPHSTDRTLGPPQIAFRPEHYVMLTEWRLTALDGLSSHRLDDAAFEWARGEYRASRQEYQQLIPRLAEDDEAASAFLPQSPAGVFLPPTDEEIVNQSCVDLLTTLGIYLNYRDREQPQPG
jgi:hypothetical protein